MERIIVRRGRYHTYELLRRTFGRDTNVEIIWDRREAQPKGKAEIPSERRGRPWVEWNQQDYIFASGTRPDLLDRKSRRL